MDFIILIMDWGYIWYICVSSAESNQHLSLLAKFTHCYSVKRTDDVESLNIINQKHSIRNNNAIHGPKLIGYSKVFARLII